MGLFIFLFLSGVGLAAVGPALEIGTGVVAPDCHALPAI